MCWINFTKESLITDLWVYNEDCYDFDFINPIPTFTLQDILDLLPKEILRTKYSWSSSLYIDYENDRIFYGNIYKEGFDIYYEVPMYEDIIDSFYEILCWCIENGYLKQLIYKNEL